jgi:uncharacterized membrane protein YqjE
MRALFGVAFAILIALELSLLAVVIGLVAMFFPLLWERSPIKAAVACVLLAAGAVALWKSWRRPDATQLPPVHPGISVSHIPISGPVGAIYMVQFVVWAILAPAVGLFYAALLGGGLLLVPVAYFVNRPGRGGATRTGLGSLLGLVSGLLFIGVVSSRQVRLAGLFTTAVVAGVLGAVVLIWLRRKPQHPSIAPYTD